METFSLQNTTDRRDESAQSIPALRRYPSKLFVETTSRCNLSCFMCVKQSSEGCVAEGDLTLELFDRLEPALAGIEALILNGVGEPLLHPQLETFIRKAKRAMPETGWVGFQTNGLLLDEQRALSLVQAGVDRICLSIDAASPEVFKRLRQGGSLSAIEKSFAALRAAQQASNRTLQIGAEFVLMADNLHELPRAIRWAARQGATFAIVTHMLPYDKAHAEQTVYARCTDAAIAFFRHWQNEARLQGLDISRYFGILWKYDKSEEERRIVDFIGQLMAEAERRKISLDLRKLFDIDLEHLAQVESVLALTRKVAEQAGLDLRLPRLLPRQERRCPFVEDGGAFVSWQGEVHPCYFLWHRYNCFADGWSQQVQPRVFGHLAHRDIVEIWNGEAFRTFRRNVIAYDHSDCVSCRLAPCDYVQTQEFEQDCHIQTEPCGSCLWCTGLFQCLN